MSAAPLFRRTAALAALTAIAAGIAVAPASAASDVSKPSVVTKAADKDPIFKATGRKAG